MQQAPERDFVRLTVKYGKDNAMGKVLDTWQEYTFSNDIFTPCDSFSFSLGLTARKKSKALSVDDIEELRELTEPDTVVRLEVGENNDIAATGIIDDQYLWDDRSGGRIDISGRDGMSILQDNDADPKTGRISDTTLPDLAARLVKPYTGYGIPYGVRSDNNSNRDILTGRKRPIKSRFGEVKPKSVRTRGGNVSIFGQGALGKNDTPADFVKLPIEEARPHAGETEYHFLERHAANLGVMMQMSAEGDIVFFRPDYNQPVLFELRRYLRNKTTQNNILSGGVRRNTANIATRVKILGHTSGRKEDKTQIKAVAELGRGNGNRRTYLSGTQYDYIWPRTKVIRDGHAKDKDRAQKEAKRALSRANANLVTLEYVMQGHTQDGILYAPDTLCHVIDEVGNINEVFYITSRTITKSRDTTRTTLKMVPSGTIVLE